MKDILIFMSDQHSPYFSGWLGGNVDTPNLDRLVQEGICFDEAYTACPLCVPARMAMMSGLSCGKTGIFTNFDSFPNTQPSILHPLVEAGYETVLCGRMHFVGLDQRHGFTRRIAPDTTPVGWDRPVEILKQERGAFTPTFGARFATNFAGGGETPVVNYDRVVINSILEYLDQDHDRPQLIVVGVYGPHFPYVAPKELYEKYLHRVSLPETFRDEPKYLNPILRQMQHPDVSDEKELAILAAYCGLIEQMDTYLGDVRAAFRYQQFIPCLDPLEEERGKTPWSLTPELFGKYLKTAFDLWYQEAMEGNKQYHRYFDNLLCIMNGQHPEACGMFGHCSMQYVIEADGSVFPCDFYMLDEYRIGNLAVDTVEQVDARRKELGFLEQSLPVAEECKKCQWHALCRGGCRRDRDYFEKGIGLNYFCPAYKEFFPYAYPRLVKLYQMLIRC